MASFFLLPPNPNNGIFIYLSSLLSYYIKQCFVSCAAQQVNIFEKEHSQANYYQSNVDVNELEQVKSEISRLINISTDDDKSVLEEALESANKNDEHGLKKALLKLATIGSSIITATTSQVLVSYMRSQGIIP